MSRLAVRAKVMATALATRDSTSRVSSTPDTARLARGPTRPSDSPMKLRRRAAVEPAPAPAARVGPRRRRRPPVRRGRPGRRAPASAIGSVIGAIGSARAPGAHVQPRSPDPASHAGATRPRRSRREAARATGPEAMVSHRAGAAALSRPGRARVSGRSRAPPPIWSRTGTNSGMTKCRRSQLAPSTTRVCPVTKAA